MNGPTHPQPLRIRLRHRPGAGSFELTADLTLQSHCITAVFGHSGCGKSTLLRCIAGLERAADALVSVRGETWQDSAKGIFTPVHRRALGFVFQEANLFPHLSVRRNLEYGLLRRPQPPGAPGMEPVCDLLGISALLERTPEALSGGERQRVAIGRALLAGPRLLLMDEPLASLDQGRRREILPYLERIRATLDLPILYVTHSPEEVTRIADELVLMDAGRVIASGPLCETLARLDLPDELTSDFGGVIHGEVTSHDAAYGLLTLRFSGGLLHLPHAPLPEGTRLRARLHARDVSLSLERPADSSIMNLIEATIEEEARADGNAHMRVRLDAGGVPIVARITRASHDRLRLRPGLRVCAQIKAVALLG